MLLFFWPIVAVIIDLRKHQPSIANLLVELSMYIATLSGITWLLLWGQSIRYGAVIAYLSIIGYGYALVAHYLRWKNRDL